MYEKMGNYEDVNENEMRMEWTQKNELEWNEIGMEWNGSYEYHGIERSGMKCDDMKMECKNGME